MRKQVAVAPSGELCVVVALYPEEICSEIESMTGFRVSISDSEPLAYVIDVGNGIDPQLFNVGTVKSHLEILGDL